MKAVDIYQNSDGTWTARIFNLSRTFKTYGEAMAWLQSQGEYQT
jgi:hypothetical protein